MIVIDNTALVIVNAVLVIVITVLVNATDVVEELTMRHLTPHALLHIA